MSQHKPSASLDVIGKLSLNPEKVAGTIAESRQQDELFVKPPNWDSPGDTVELLAIQNDREYIGMVQLQQDMLDNARRQSVINANRIEELYKMQTVIRKRFIEANNFFKDCDDKKKFAELKVSEEKQLHQHLKKLIHDNKANIGVLTEFRDAIQATVKQFEPYEEVINAAIAQNPNWATVKDCIDRCDALMTTQVDICEMKRQKILEIEELRQNMVKMTNEAALTVLGLNNELAELERAYSQARSQCLKLEKIIVNIKACLIDERLVKARIFDEIQLLYRRLCKRRGITPVLRRYDTEEQLDFIKDEILILRDVVKECVKTMKR